MVRSVRVRSWGTANPVAWHVAGGQPARRVTGARLGSAGAAGAGGARRLDDPAAGRPRPVGAGSRAGAGAGIARKYRRVRRAATLVVVWEADQREPWLVLTDLDLVAVGRPRSAARTWVELGVWALKRLGWHGERSRRTDPERVARHWLVLSVATLWAVATVTREEDARRLGRASSSRTPPRRRRGSSGGASRSSLAAWPASAGRCVAAAACGPPSGSGPSRGRRPGPA